jgi:Dolichyl-phosphate-mannose-protein mannosyltransferase
VALTVESARLARGRDLVPVFGLAAGVLVVHAVLAGRFGFHRDELVDLAAGRRPAAGYVDRPPLVPLLARGLTAVAGEHLWPLRVVAAAAHAGVVVVTGLIAARLGGRPRALVLAGLAAALAPGLLAAGSVLGPLGLGLLWWSLALLAVVHLLGGADPRWWLAVGLLVGLGLETHPVGALTGGALAAGLVVVPESRRLLGGRWPLAGLALALALWVPNLTWQAGHGWPAVGLAGRASGAVDPGVGSGVAGFAVGQVLLAGPVGLACAAAGVVWLARRRPWRALAVASVLVVAGLVVGDAAPEAAAPVYVLGFAAGAVAADRWVGWDERRLHKVVAGLVAVGLLAAPAVVPATSAHAYGTLYHDLYPGLGEQVGWLEMVDLVATVRDVLPAADRDGLRVVTATAGEAAAIDLYGPARGLARGTALSADGIYAGRWPAGEPAGTVIFVRWSRREIAPYCDVSGPVVVVGNSALVPNDVAGATVSLCRELRVTPEQLREVLRSTATAEM